MASGGWGMAIIWKIEDKGIYLEEKLIWKKLVILL